MSLSQSQIPLEGCREERLLRSLQQRFTAAIPITQAAHHMLQKHVKNVKIAKGVGIAMGVGGTLVVGSGIVVGLVLAPATLGGSLAVLPMVLSVSGSVGRAVGGMTVAGSKIVQTYLSYEILKDMDTSNEELTSPSAVEEQQLLNDINTIASHLGETFGVKPSQTFYTLLQRMKKGKPWKDVPLEEIHTEANDIPDINIPPGFDEQFAYAKDSGVFDVTARAAAGSFTSLLVGLADDIAGAFAKGAGTAASVNIAKAVLGGLAVAVSTGFLVYDIVGLVKSCKNEDGIVRLLRLVVKSFRNQEGYIEAILGLFTHKPKPPILALCWYAEGEESESSIRARLESTTFPALAEAMQSHSGDPCRILEHVLTTYPPRVKSMPYDPEAMARGMKKYVRKALGLYHPDKQVGLPMEWMILCEEISKYLNVCYKELE